MGRFGFGPRTQRAMNKRQPPLALVSPAVGWTGAAGSGFATVPADPARTTAKPVCRLLVPPFQWFVDELLVGVYAGANYNGSLAENMGLEKVVLHCEGTSVDILEPTFQTFADANGNPVTYFGWWAKLKHDGRHGHGRVYFEAIPKDATMQRRVMGPYQYSPQAMLHDYLLEVAATPAEIVGTRYKTITAAHTWLKSVNAKNPLITITEAGTYIATSISGGWYGGTTAAPALGHSHIVATVPVTIGLAAPAANADVSPIRFELNCLHLKGSNITVDFQYASEFYNTGSDGRQNWFDGINITSSPGRYELRRGTIKSSTAWLFRGAAYVTECHFTNLWNALKLTSLSRGNLIEDCWLDLFNGCHLAIGNRIDDFDSSAYRQRIPALSVSYTGAEATATLSRSTNTLTASYGASSATFTIGSALADYNANTNY